MLGKIVVIGLIVVGLAMMVTAVSFSINVLSTDQVYEVSKEGICQKLNSWGLSKTECNINKKTKQLEPTLVQGTLQIEQLNTKEGVVYKVYSK